MSLSPTDPAVAPAIEHAEAVAAVLQSNVVQGQLKGEDTYSMSLPAERRPFESPVGSTNSIAELRIHDQTEKGDNDSVKMPGQSAAGGGCCQS